MADDKTTVTELGTAFGMTGHPTVQAALAARPRALINVSTDTWERLDRLWAAGDFVREFQMAFANGAFFLQHPDALRGRRPRVIEWKGSHKPLGDEVVPADLRADHVYLVSCKYLSRNITNASPFRLFDDLLTSAPVRRGSDWYAECALAEYEVLYRVCVESTGLLGMPATPTGLTKSTRARLRRALRSRSWPAEAQALYRELCQRVAAVSAERWQAHLPDCRTQEIMLWRLLRIASAPYFVLGHDGANRMALRVGTPWDWRQLFTFGNLDIAADLKAGQPRVSWSATYCDLLAAEDRHVDGHVEVRWSHGRFGSAPEAKVYLDTPHAEVPGYFPLP
ncbi:MAG: hypothetical protein DYH08_14675 [Actinobacteria bacterium ATB1]|nr:hypothetical protein [Actinobacteria bacterium ATB1]